MRGIGVVAADANRDPGVVVQPKRPPLACVGARLVLAVEPSLDYGLSPVRDGRSAVPWMPAIGRVLAEQLGDRRRVVRLPGATVSVEPALGGVFVNHRRQGR